MKMKKLKKATLAGKTASVTKRALCLALASLMLAALLGSCGSAPENVFRITVDGGNGAQTYTVSYEFYRVIFNYLKMNVSSVVQDAQGNASLATADEQNAAIKEVAENKLVEFYSLVSLGKQYGISITDEDREAFDTQYRKQLQAYVEEIDEEDFDFKGTKEEYARTIYENAMKLAGTTPEYYEFSHYCSLLSSRLKAAIGGELSDYLDQSYYHYKQILVVYTKGDATAEAQAQAAIESARRLLADGASIDDVIAQYGSRDYQSEFYFDAYGNIVGSASGNTLGTVVVNAIKALDENETSDIMTGDESDRLAYFAIYQRLGFDPAFVCSDDPAAEQMYEYPYVDSSYMTPHFTRYTTILEAYRQNTAIEPLDIKWYNKLNVHNVK